MHEVYSVRIIRKTDQVLPAFFLAEFWKLCGVDVREYITDEEHTDVNGKAVEVDVNIVLVQNAKMDRLPGRSEIICTDLSLEADVSNQAKRKEFCEGLKRNLFEKFNKMELDATLCDNLQKIMDVFCIHDYAYQNYLAHLYLYQMSEEERERALQTYINCYNELYKIAETNSDCHTMYAYLDCARKSNRVCDARGELRIFDDKKLMEYAIRISEGTNDFYMGDVLAGLIGLNSREDWRAGENYLNNVINGKEQAKKSAFLYYSLGHFYETERQSGEKAWAQYQKMAEVAPDSYRAVFKEGCHAYYAGNKAEACKKFYKIYRQMARKEKYLMPLELEYYQKCTCLLSNRSFRAETEKRDPTISEKKAEQIRNEIFTQNGVNRNLFGTYIRTVRDHFEKKMSQYHFAINVRI